MSTFNLTESQRTAIDDFKAFLNGRQQVFMLKGAAGTGKTTLINEFLGILNSLNLPSVLMAPTGRAAFILSDKTGHPAFTIHRTIYRLSKLESASRNKEEDVDDGVQAKFSLKDNSNSKNTIYIVDEASMVDDAVSESEAFSY